MRLLRSAWVIGRRDFAATVFSKAFIFFLIGPLFPLLLGVMFGGIGAHVASTVEQPQRVAVIAPRAEFERIDRARDDLASAIGDRQLVDIVGYEPTADPGLQSSDLLASSRDNIVATLTGGLDHPHLSGSIDRDGTVASQVRTMIDLARSNGSRDEIAFTHVERPAGVQGRPRAVTAQMGQTALFFLTLILAGMTLSQLIEEKSNKVIEVLAAAVPIESIFVGKLFAMLATSVVGIVVWTFTGVAAVSLLSGGGGAAGAVLQPPAVGAIPFLLLCIAYFGMNYLLLGSVFLSIGAQASTVREVQTLSMPVTVAQVLIFGLAALGVGNPNSPLAIAGAIFPLSSPLAMVARAAEEPQLWPHLVAILWQGLWVGLVIYFASRLFRRTVLKSGPQRRRGLRKAAA